MVLLIYQDIIQPYSTHIRCKSLRDVILLFFKIRSLSSTKYPRKFLGKPYIRTYMHHTYIYEAEVMIANDLRILNSKNPNFWSSTKYTSLKNLQEYLSLVTSPYICIVYAFSWLCTYIYMHTYFVSHKKQSVSL